eukprot:12916184-Prorocentrum_lima.AAC.1
MGPFGAHPDHRGPLFVAQLQGTAKTYMQERFEQAIYNADIRCVTGIHLTYLAGSSGGRLAGLQ